MTDKEFRIFKVACQYWFLLCAESGEENISFDKIVDDVANECWVSITQEQTDNAIEYLKEIDHKIWACDD